MIGTRTQTGPRTSPRMPAGIRLPRVRPEPLLAGLAILASVTATLVYVWALCPHDLAPDEAHYWDWSRHLDWSYYSKGPLVAWLIRASCEVFGPLSVELTGNLAAAVRLPAVLCHAATLAAWYVLAAGVFRSSRFGMTVVVLAALLPVVRIGAVVMTIDPPFLACWAWGLVCVWRALETDRIGWWVGAAIATALGVLAKYTMLLFPAAVIAYLIVHRSGELRRSGAWLLVAGSAAGCVPIIAWNAAHDWVSFRHVLGQVGGRGDGLRWLGPLSFLGGQAGMMFGLWLAAFLAAAWRYRPTREAEPAVRLLWWASVPVWLLFTLASFMKPGQANWPAPAYVGGFVLAAAWMRDQLTGPWRKLVGRCLGVNVVLGIAVAVGTHHPAPFRPLLARLAAAPSSSDPVPVRRLDVTARLAGWNALAAEVDRLRDRISAETGREPVLAGTYWTIPGHLAFSCAGHPVVYAVGIPNGTDRHSQYDLWRPNPVSDAQAFAGRSFVIVGDIGRKVAAAFDRVEQPVRVVHAENGIPLEVWTVWVCHGFRGFDGRGEHASGY